MITAVAMETPSSDSVNVPCVAVVFTTIISVITVVVDAGTVYKVVLPVVAAPRKSAFEMVAISYNFPLVDVHYVSNCRTLKKRICLRNCVSIGRIEGGGCNDLYIIASNSCGC